MKSLAYDLPAHLYYGDKMHNINTLGFTIRSLYISRV